MSPENTEKLFETYPDLYAGHQDGPKHSLMCFGFECGDGWFDLIDELSRQITELAPDVVAVQVKEKWGGLRFYVNSAPDIIYDIIDQFESCSYKICEMCGNPGEPREGGWIKVLCNKCEG